MAGLAIDVDELIAIDVHTHAEVSRDGHASLSPELLGASEKYFKAHGHRQPTIEEMAAHYRERKLAAVVFTVDAEHATGWLRISNEEVAESCAEHPDVLIPFASVDPHKGRAGVREARRLVEEHGVRGFKFHPSIQGFAPDDPLAYPLYEAIEELGVPALFHTGQTGIGAGVPGGGGIRKYFPPQLVRYANTLLKDKVLFGSDYPVISPDRWLADFGALEIKPEVRPKILKDNAARLLGLGAGKEHR
ncbi:amidohydrolase family protein [Spirillospora sp. NPDC049024]